MYARGMPVREIQAFLQEQYGTEVSPEFISSVTDAVLGVLPDGSRDILGLWIENTEGTKFWMKFFNDLKTRFAPIGFPRYCYGLQSKLISRMLAATSRYPETFTSLSCSFYICEAQTDPEDQFQSRRQNLA